MFLWTRHHWCQKPDHKCPISQNWLWCCNLVLQQILQQILSNVASHSEPSNQTHLGSLQINSSHLPAKRSTNKLHHFSHHQTNSLLLHQETLISTKSPHPASCQKRNQHTSCSPLIQYSHSPRLKQLPKPWLEFP